MEKESNNIANYERVSQLLHKEKEMTYYDFCLAIHNPLVPNENIKKVWMEYNAQIRDKACMAQLWKKL